MPPGTGKRTWPASWFCMPDSVGMAAAREAKATAIAVIENCMLTVVKIKRLRSLIKEIGFLVFEKEVKR